MDCNKVPEDILECAKEVSLNLLPQKSREIYESAYQRFVEWCKEKTVQIHSEDVLMVYFANLPKKVKPSTLNYGHSIQCCDQHSILKTEQNEGYTPKKAPVFKKEQVDRFLHTAPDNLYLMMKVVLILGIAGACRSDELVNVETDNIKDVKSALIIAIPNTKTKRPRSFTVLAEDYLSLFRK
ncbi:hypothetical protein Zmor_006244 [Zophobas morio]|uniref:Tyr recombinase domain-containing protein n=1 Tax=Zophobas morio TaxID=2755281 RepID=A0AA38MMP0_9CUCU|nr:hypothetical protein Zmor_006244 [Zophobas morio]